MTALTRRSPKLAPDYQKQKVRPGDAISFGSQVAQQASGRCPQRGANGFYHAAKVQIPVAASWTYARGVEFKPGSARGVR